MYSRSLPASKSRGERDRDGALEFTALEVFAFGILLGVGRTVTDFALGTIKLKCLDGLLRHPGEEGEEGEEEKEEGEEQEEKKKRERRRRRKGDRRRRRWRGRSGLSTQYPMW